VKPSDRPPTRRASDSYRFVHTMMSRIGRRAIITPIIALPIFLLLFHATLSYFPPFDDTGERVPNPTYGFLFRTGRMAWPGTYVVVKPIYDDTALLERRWLFLWEARQTVTHDPVEGWILASEVLLVQRESRRSSRW
jgi:hypothetical protein